MPQWGIFPFTAVKLSQPILFRVHSKLSLVGEEAPPEQSTLDGGDTVHNRKIKRQFEMHTLFLS
jgi:hypothetical protein